MTQDLKSITVMCKWGGDFVRPPNYSRGMRKHLRLVALIIPMVLVASNSYAAVKVGSSCSKAGIKSVSAGKTYTCVKSGKKLVWDKGVAVSKPAATSGQTSSQPVTQSTQVVQPISPTGVPSNLVASEVAAFINLSWDAPKSPDVAPEFYRIEGTCSQSNTSCGTFQVDVWHRSDSGELDTKYGIQKESLKNSSDGAVWIFAISALNQSRNIQGAIVQFAPITIGQMKPGGNEVSQSTLTIKELDSCSKLGQRIQNANNLFECRRMVGNKLVWMSIHADLPTEIRNVSSPEPTSTCQLRDKRTSKLTDWPAIAYPATAAPGFTTKGTFKIIVVGIDFPDVRGSGKPSDVWKSDITKAKEWMDWYSSGQVKYEFVSKDEWIHASKPSKTFNTATESVATGNQKEAGGLTPNEIATTYLNLVGNSVDISGAAVVWVYYPKNITDITGQWTSQLAGPVKTDKYGTVNTFIVADAQETYEGRRDIWAYFLHELVHRHGVFGHSPKVPVLTGMMSTFNGWTYGLLPWDALAVDWQSPGDYYCVNQNDISKPVDITLVPLEREQKGYKAVTIKLSESQLLIIDSHRRDKWSADTMPGQYGVMMTLVDTTKNSSFAVGENGNEPSTANFVKMSGTNHGAHQFFAYGIEDKGVYDDGKGVANDLDTSGQVWTFDLNYLMYLGESENVQGVKISLIKSGDNDTVRIERA